MDVRFPPWLDELPDDERPAAKCRFLLRLAALHFSPSGKLNLLSQALELHPGSLATYEAISGELAVRLETLLGSENFPRSLFRPDLFAVES